MTEITATATYAKLRSGDWGLRLTGALPKPGASITVTQKDGSTRTERVGRIVWQGSGVALATIAREHVCCECGQPSRTQQRCGQCGLPLHITCSYSVKPVPICRVCAERWNLSVRGDAS
jgi:hypothetical protein